MSLNGKLFNFADILKEYQVVGDSKASPVITTASATAVPGSWWRTLSSVVTAAAGLIYSPSTAPVTTAHAVPAFDLSAASNVAAKPSTSTPDDMHDGSTNTKTTVTVPISNASGIAAESSITNATTPNPTTVTDGPMTPPK